MANNRMWLIYKPTGHAVLLAKRMGDGWYLRGGPHELGQQIYDFFAAVDEAQIEARVLCAGGQDGFALGLEDPGINQHSFNAWKYGADQAPGGVRKLKIFTEG